jgi:hypothetical protein
MWNSVIGNACARSPEQEMSHRKEKLWNLPADDFFVIIMFVPSCIVRVTVPVSLRVRILKGILTLLVKTGKSLGEYSPNKGT